MRSNAINLLTSAGLVAAGVAASPTLAQTPTPPIRSAAHTSPALDPGQAGADANPSRTTAASSGIADAAAGEQDTAQTGIPDVVVTAEKRSTNLQRTPIAVTALDGQALQRAQVRTITDIQSLVPSFQMGQSTGRAQITIRGIGSVSFAAGAEGVVAVNQNEIYISRPIATLAGQFDISSLEVLRGPQGTLYGRNATAGSVNITTTRPTDVGSGYGRLSIGNYHAVNGEAAVGGPIIDGLLLARVAGFIERRNGYGRNLVTGNDIDDKDAWGIRGTIVLTPTPEVKATLIGEYYHQDDNGSGLHYFGAAGLLGLKGSVGVAPAFVRLGGYSAPNVEDIANGVDPKFLFKTSAATGIIEWNKGPFGLKSVTGYREQNGTSFESIDGGSTLNFIVRASEPADQFSQELQAHYDTAKAHLTTGLYYFHEKVAGSPFYGLANSDLLLPLFGKPAPKPSFFDDFSELGGTIKTNAKAAFGQGTLEVAEGLSLTAGLRYSEEKKQLFSRNRTDFTLSRIFPFNPGNPLAAPPLPPTVTFPARTFKSTTPKLGIQYQADPRTLVYASYSKGFKSGGFDISTQAPAYEPEKLTDYEVGLKVGLLENRLRLNLSGFYYDYTNLQVQQVIGFTVVTQNAATARIYGAEAEFTAVPIEPITISGFVSYLHARYRSYFGADPVQTALPGVDFSGKRMNNAPDWRANLSAAYRQPVAAGALTARVEGEYTSKFYFTPSNLDLLGQRAFFKANAFLTYDSDQHWYLTAFVRNVTDKITRTSALVNAASLGSPAQGSLAPPRVIGAEIGFRF